MDGDETLIAHTFGVTSALRGQAVTPADHALQPTGASHVLIAATSRSWAKVLDDSRYLWRVAAFVVGLLAIVILGQYDPGRVWAWLAD